MSRIRDFRLSAKLSQAAFAELLCVPAESYRVWDSGRRQPPSAVLAQAQEFAETRSDERPLPLPKLARLLGVNVQRLRDAARTGRLAVTYDNRAVFGHLVPRATRAAGVTYKRQYYGKKARWTLVPPPPHVFPVVPPDYDQRVAALRDTLGLSQSQLALEIGAAGKAVVYQWESRKRVPSRLFWSRVVALERAGSQARSASRET